MRLLGGVKADWKRINFLRSLTGGDLSSIGFAFH